MNWLQSHLETFVVPVIGRIPRADEMPNFLTPFEMARIKNAWRAAKKNCGDRTMLLPGRDVWIFEVLAKRENYPTLFIPQCSRLALSQISFSDPEKYFILDTGFMGSIPRGLSVNNFLLLSHIVRGSETKQVFPAMAHSRALALKIEYLPKYWKSGFHRETYVGQELSDKVEFTKAAILTQQIYKDSSPKFIAWSLNGQTTTSKNEKTYPTSIPV